VPLKHRIIAWFFRFFLRMRYKVIFKNKEILLDKQAKIFFPNHPALIDPIILSSFIYKYNHISPVVSAKYYRNTLFKPILKLINAIPVADLSEGERDANVYQKLARNTVLQLQKGHHVLLYPGGQLSGQETEKLHNKQGAYRLTGELPENVKIIGVRISGLWGSRWSRAKTGKTPHFIKVFFKSLGYLSLTLFVFCPKRTVTFEFEDLSIQLKELSKKDRKSFNEFLEKFYSHSN